MNNIEDIVYLRHENGTIFRANMLTDTAYVWSYINSEWQKSSVNAYISIKDTVYNIINGKIKSGDLEIISRNDIFLEFM